MMRCDLFTRIGNTTQQSDKIAIGGNKKMPPTMNNISHAGPKGSLGAEFD